MTTGRTTAGDMSDRLLLTEIDDRTGSLTEDAKTLLSRGVAAACDLAGRAQVHIEIAVVGDDEMHTLNRRWLDHDYPTDVLSFLLDGGGDTRPTEGGGWVVAPLSGQLILNPDHAAREAPTHGWPPHALPAAVRELALYAVHGTLHLLGHDDRTPEDRRAMRRAEAAALSACGVAVPAGHEEV